MSDDEYSAGLNDAGFAPAVLPMCMGFGGEWEQLPMSEGLEYQ